MELYHYSQRFGLHFPLHKQKLYKVVKMKQWKEATASEGGVRRVVMS